MLVRVKLYLFFLFIPMWMLGQNTDSDFDSILDTFDIEINSPFGYRVDTNGKAVGIMWELPKTTSYQCRPGYCFNYSEKEEQSLWVCYMLTKADLQGTAKRTNIFREDTLIETGSAISSDYRKSGYDRGHMKPAANNKDSQKEMNASFLMTNISPQHPSVNRITWKAIEDYERSLLKTYDSLFVVTGVIFRTGHKRIGKNEVGVPRHFYKCIVAKKDTSYYGVAFLVPNKKAKKDIWVYSETIKSVQRKAGLNFYYLFPQHIQLSIKKTNIISK